MSIKTKLIVGIACILIIVDLMMVFAIYKQNSKKLDEHAQTDIANNIHYTTQLVNFYLGRARDNLTSLANDPIIIDALETKSSVALARASERLTIINEAIAPIEGIGLLEINGSTCTNIAADKYSLSVVGRNFSDRDHCKGIIATKSPYVSSAYVSAVTKHVILGIAIPVQNAKGAMLGYILGTVNSSELRGYLLDLQQDSAVDLLDRYGTLFLTTKKQIETLDTKPGSQDSEIAEVQKRLAENKKEGYFMYGSDFVGYKDGAPVTVIFEKSNASLIELNRAFYLTFIGYLMGAVVLIIILIYFFIGIIVRRILRISEVAQQIAQGKFDIKLDKKYLEANDATGVLARAFNDMAVNLSSLYKNIEQKVAERTAEVEQKNKDLLETEARLTKELYISERTTHAMVDRELEMKKLKERIKTLEKTQNNQ